MNKREVLGRDSGASARAPARAQRAVLLLAALLAAPLALAARADAFVYWAAPGDPSAIGRANLDGSGVDSGFISLPKLPGDDNDETPCGVAVDASHIYWADSANARIGRANL